MLPGEEIHSNQINLVDDVVRLAVAQVRAVDVVTALKGDVMNL